MEIRKLTLQDIPASVALLMRAYNGAPWNEQWSPAPAHRYLTEFAEHARFVGFALFEGSQMVGAAFCHEKTWWTGDELFVDEFFVDPAYQRKGYGQTLLKHIEGYIHTKGLAGFTLLTNRYMPAIEFYRKYGFTHAEHVAFLYKMVQGHKPTL